MYNNILPISHTIIGIIHKISNDHIHNYIIVGIKINLINNDKILIGIKKENLLHLIYIPIDSIHIQYGYNDLVYNINESLKIIPNISSEEKNKYKLNYLQVASQSEV